MNSPDELNEMKLSELLELQATVSKVCSRRIGEFRERVRRNEDDSTRAPRQSNEQTIKDAVLKVLGRAKEVGLTKEEIAARVVTEEKYSTKSDGKNWIRSVYQSGILPLLNSGFIEREGEVYRLVA